MDSPNTPAPQTSASNPAPGIVAAPVVPTGPVLSAVEQATAAARATLATGQSLVTNPPAPPAVPPVAPAPGQPRVPAGQPEGGQWTAPPAGQGAPAADPNAPAPPADPNAPPPPAGAEELAPAEAPANPLAVEVPLGDEPLVLEAADPETAAKLAELADLAQVGQESVLLREQLDAEAADLHEQRAKIAADPVGAALDVIGNNIAAAEALVMYLVTQSPTFFRQIAPKLGALADGTTLREQAVAIREQRTAEAAHATTAIAQDRAVRANLRDVNMALDALLADPALSDAQRRVARTDAARDLQLHAERQRLVTLPVDQLPTLLSARLTALGINPEAAAARAGVALARSQRGSTARALRSTAASARSSAGAPPSTPAAGTARPAAPTGAQFVTSATARRAAAALPPGAGSPSAGGGIQLQKGADGKPVGIEEAIRQHRENIARGVRVIGTGAG